MRAHCVGPVPTDLRQMLEGAGLIFVSQDGDPADPDLQVVFFDAMGEAQIAAASSRDIPCVAVVRHEGDIAAARSAGAVEVLIEGAAPADLQDRFRTLVATFAVWRRRLVERERAAQRAMDEQRSTQELLERLIDATPNPVMAADLHGRVLVFNRVAETALGYSARYAKEQMHVTDVYANSSDARRVLSEIRRSEDRIAHGIEVRLRARSGEHIPVVLSAGEVTDAQGQAVATVGVFQDLREQIALRHRLEATTEQLIQSEKRAATIEVAGAAAHELNQPLTAVMGTIELLEINPTLDRDVKKRLNKAYQQLERMVEIVRALARTSRPRTTGYVGAQRILDLSDDE